MPELTATIAPPNKTIPKPKARPKSTEVDPHDVIAKLEELVEIICAGDDLKVVKAAPREIEKLEILEARDDPKRETRLEKLAKKLNTKLRKTEVESVSDEIQHICDTISDSRTNSEPYVHEKVRMIPTMRASPGNGCVI